MVNVIVKTHNLQELVRKVHLDGLINNAVIQFKDNRMKIEAIGIEDKEGIIDNTLTIDVNYPCETVEGGLLGIGDLGAFLHGLEQFERDDVIQISSTETVITVTRASPLMSIDFEAADVKFIKTYAMGLKVIFGTPIKIVRADGKEKLFAFDSSITVDAQKLKQHGATISSIPDVKNMQIIVKDGKLSAEAKGTYKVKRDLEGITTITGNAEEIYSKDIFAILKTGIGVATLKFSKASPIHISYVHESMTADYLLQAWDGR